MGKGDETRVAAGTEDEAGMGSAVSRRPFLVGVATLGLVGTSGFTGVAAGASTCSGVTLTFRGPKALQVTGASLLDALSVYYVDGTGERALLVVDGPTLAADYGVVRLRYDAGRDLATLSAAGAGTTLVYAVAEGPTCRSVASNPKAKDVPADFNSPPTASFTVSNTQPEAGTEAVTFTSTTTDPDLPDDQLTHEWDLDGDGSFEATGEEVTYTYQSTDSVTVTYRVTDAFGASDTAQQVVSPQASDPYAQLQKLGPAGPFTGSLGFGFSVAVAGDTAVVGAPYDDDFVGSASVFRRTNGVWSLEQTLRPAAATDRARFGFSLALGTDVVYVGAPYDESGGGDGSVYTFTRSGSTWTQSNRLSPFGLGEEFGYSLALSGDGGSLVVGVPGYDSLRGNQGAVFVLENGVGRILTADDALSGEGDKFGFSVAISGDTLLVGAPFDRFSYGSGSVYVLVRSGSGWSQAAKIRSQDESEAGRFGTAVSLAGSTALVGAPFGLENGVNTGAVFGYTGSGSNWTQTQKLTGSETSTLSGFGHALDRTGDTLLVGAPFENTSTGAAHLFSASGGQWTELARLAASDAASPDSFGYAVALSSDTAFVGAYRDDETVVAEGSAYVFEV